MKKQSTKGSEEQSEGTDVKPSKNSVNPMDMGKQMMKKMMGEGLNPPAMKEKMKGQKGDSTEGNGNPMQQMMGMCKEMLHSMQQTTSLAVYAQPELQQLFGEWLITREQAVLKQLEKGQRMDLVNLSKTLAITPESTLSILARLHGAGKIQLGVEIRKP